MGGERRWTWVPVLLAVVFLAAEAWQVLLPRPGNPEALPYPHLPTDQAAYLSFVQQGVAGGGPFARNLFTTEEQDGRFLMISLTAAGWLVRATGLPVPWVWHVLRLVGLAGVIFSLWRLIRVSFPSWGGGLWAWSLVLFGGGMEVLVQALASWGIGTDPGLSHWARNPWNFSLFWSGAVFVWSWPLWVLLAWLHWEIRRPEKAMSGAGTWLWRGAIFALLFALHPYTALFQGLLVAFLVARELVRGLRTSGPFAAVRLLPVLIGPILVGVYALWARGDAVYRWSSEQVGLWRLSYPPWVWPLACGPQVLLGLAGLGRDRDGERGFGWVQAWAAIGVLATVNPWVTGVKFQPLLIIPLGLLAARGGIRIAGVLGLRPAIRPLVAALLVSASASSFLAGLVRDFRDPATREVLNSLPGEREAWEALAGMPEGGVLCLPRTALWVPGHAGQPVFVGQWFLSTRFGEKERLVRWFYQGPATDTQRHGFLRAARIRYLLHGPRERSTLGDVPSLPGLVRRWTGGEFTIWEVGQMDSPDRDGEGIP